MNTDDWPLHEDPEFARIWQQVAPYTMTSPQRGFALWQAVNYVLDNDIQGAFVECGVWRGGSAMLIALTLKARGASRNLFLFDTFDGMTSPSGIDTDRFGNAAADLLQGKQGERLAELVTARATLDEVSRLMLTTEYDPRLVYYVHGDVVDTLPKTQTLHIALLRLDTDFYDSTASELVHLYPRVQELGVVIIDDYGHWRGARQAADEYFSNLAYTRKKPMFWAIDYTGRAFVKPEAPSQVEIDRYDYVPPGMADPKLLDLFPSARPFNPWEAKWPYLRASIPHIFRVDTRNKNGFLIGNASYEEAVCLHTIARQFAGKRGLEIGSHFGWTSAHLQAAGLDMDYLDPEFADADRVAAVDEVLKTIDTNRLYRLWPLYSPQAIPQVRKATPYPWSFIFIDGDHDENAPEDDAVAVIGFCAEDAVVVFHDMTSPSVARGLAVFKQAGWQVRLYNTMQVLGIAWRGNVTIPDHVRDPSAFHLFQPHLRDFPLT